MIIIIIVLVVSQLSYSISLILSQFSINALNTSFSFYLPKWRISVVLISRTILLSQTLVFLIFLKERLELQLNVLYLQTIGWFLHPIFCSIDCHMLLCTALYILPLYMYYRFSNLHKT